MTDKLIELLSVSNPLIAQQNAYKYLGKANGKLYVSDRKDKKYYVINPNTKEKIHFGSIKYEDYTKHKNKERRRLYLLRSSNIKGDWKDDPYSPNNLSRNILW